MNFNFQSILTSFTNPSWDLILIVVFIGAAFLYGLILGRNKLIALLLSTYFSLVIIGAVPWKTFVALFGLKDLPSPTFRIYLFLALILFFFFIIPHSVLGSSLRIAKHGQSSWFQILIFAICQIGLLTSIILSFLPSKVIADLSPLIKQFFVGQTPQFFWLTIPIFAMVLLRKKHKEED